MWPVLLVYDPNTRCRPFDEHWRSSKQKIKDWVSLGTFSFFPFPLRFGSTFWKLGKRIKSTALVRSPGSPKSFFGVGRLLPCLTRKGGGWMGGVERGWPDWCESWRTAIRCHVALVRAKQTHPCLCRATIQPVLEIIPHLPPCFTHKQNGVSELAWRPIPPCYK